MTNSAKPTVENYSDLQKAYDFFNERLFSGSLPECLITLQREKSTMGYFSAARFYHVVSGVKTDEIALNPSYFSCHPPVEIFQTLVHEMAHLWQHHHGDPGRGRYHNKEWADMMESIGLMPSSTGKPGGDRTGDRISDYPIEGGPFLQAYNELVTDEFMIRWYDRFPARDHFNAAVESGEFYGDIADLVEAGIVVQEDTGALAITQNKTNRVKYTCRSCESNVWGKPLLNVICGDCNVSYEPNE